jgi:hypothetical protein
MKAHKHYWRKFLNSDETGGGFVHCRCGDIRFCDPKQFKKFMKLIKYGIKGNEISLNPKK